MKSILLSVVAATLLTVSGAFTSSADAQTYVRYGRGGYYAPRYNYNYGPRYVAPYRTYYRGNPYYGGGYYNARPYYGGYRGGYYGGGYYGRGIGVGVGPARVGVRF
ncbi:hypothetical protein [Anatilimnocola floriformis]|uniref:hypothetical protein n=1 Tax=Anatilimnocola floriformis TaxID=2948575 RepID=UPI0020C3C2AF|nr:hypothetical protein [Anatilimnocola floriformis]